MSEYQANRLVHYLFETSKSGIFQIGTDGGRASGVEYILRGLREQGQEDDLDSAKITASFFAALSQILMADRRGESEKIEEKLTSIMSQATSESLPGQIHKIYGKQLLRNTAVAVEVTRNGQYTQEIAGPGLALVPHDFTAAIPKTTDQVVAEETLNFRKGASSQHS